MVRTRMGLRWLWLHLRCTSRPSRWSRWPTNVLRTTPAFHSTRQRGLGSLETLGHSVKRKCIGPPALNVVSWGTGVVEDEVVGWSHPYYHTSTVSPLHLRCTTTATPPFHPTRRCTSLPALHSAPFHFFKKR